MIDIAGKRAYLIGIGGCGMSGLARMLRSRGVVVSGSDSTPSEATAALIAEGVPISFNQWAGTLPSDCDFIVASAAIKPDHPECVAATARGIRIYTYAQALGAVMDSATGIAIAGTHGKSTTTAMLGAALADAGLDPTVIVGATCRQLAVGCLAENRTAVPTGFRLGSPMVPAGPLEGRAGLLIAEACEFNRSFHNFRPLIASISAVEADHLDIYGSLDAIVEAFHDFARLVASESEGGRLLIAHDGAHRREVTAGVTCAVETIGFSPEADWVVTYDPSSRRVRVRHDGREIGAWECLMPGGHNAMNSAMAFVLGVMAGGEPEILAASLGRFAGVDRRMECLGWRPVAGGGTVRVYDDYGHHPTEVDVTLRALREHERPQERGGRLICVFQPHQHSRTRHLLEEFAAAFSSADVVIVPHIYFVRDSVDEQHKVTAADLVDRLRERGVRAMHLYPFDAIVEQLEHLCHDGDLLVVMGAGPVWQIARNFLRAGRSPALVATSHVERE